MTKLEKRFGYRALPEGGSEFRVRDAMGSTGCLLTFVLIIFLYFWILGVIRYVELRKEGRSTDNAYVLLLFVPFLIALWFMGPNTLFFRTRVVVSAGRLRVLRWFRWTDVDVKDVEAIERFVHQSTHRRDHPDQPATSLHYACRIRLKDGKELVFGHNHEPADLDGLASTLRALTNVKAQDAGAG
jgi:uncharacterized membrane protein YwzB